MHSPTQLRSLTASVREARGLSLHAHQPGLLNKLGRVAWGIVWALLFRPSPRPLHAWRAFLLRSFGARLGAACHIYPRARIWAPWNLVCREGAAIADDAVIYNAARVSMGEYAIVSQQAYVCTATHDFDDPAFPMVVAPIALGARAWVCARACVLPGITVGDGAVLGLAAVATRDLEPWQVYAGNPARRLKSRRSQ
jgi:putative colanic acid biosynthesis acetyltransferase WcaF